MVDTVDDISDFKAVSKALDVCDFTKEEQEVGTCIVTCVRSQNSQHVYSVVFEASFIHVNILKALVSSIRI